MSMLCLHEVGKEKVVLIESLVMASKEVKGWSE